MWRLIWWWGILGLESLYAIVPAPQVKWTHKGGGPFIMDGAYAGSPAVADLDGDGHNEVIWANYMLYVVDGATGASIWSVYTGHDRSYTGQDWVGRTYPAVVVADVDQDQDLEIITAHEQGYLAIYNHQGFFHAAAWPKQPCPTSEFRGLCGADLDADGKLEILAGCTRASNQEHDWYIYRENGEMYPGWPQTARHHCNHGGFNQNLAVADLNQDHTPEIIALADVFYLNAFRPDGAPLQSSAFYDSKIWSEIPIWFHLESERRGWGDQGEYLPKFPFSAPLIADVNADSSPEIVLVGNVCEYNGVTSRSLYYTPMIFEADRTRFQQNGFNWHVFPAPTDLKSSGPLCEEWPVMKICLPNPVAADLDGDQYQEILYASYDGKLHAYWLDRTEHYHWPYSIYQPGEGTFRFATEPAIADLDHDGFPEIIFGSWTQHQSQKNGKLHILDFRGNLLHEIDVPNTSRGWNGITSAPTIANIDADADLEIVVGTAWSGICAYDLPGSAGAKVIWGTGQGNFQRTGAVLSPTAPVSPNRSVTRPIQFRLLQNYPNPFQDHTTIGVKLTQPARLRLAVHNILGQQVTRLFAGELPAGEYRYPLARIQNGHVLPTGLYYCRLQVENQIQILKIVIVD